MLVPPEEREIQEGLERVALWVHRGCLDWLEARVKLDSLV